jgi:hypothetical protein
MVHVNTFTTQYEGMAKAYGLKRPVGATTIVEMAPEDLHLLEPAKLGEWATPANRSHVSRKIHKMPDYWGTVSSNEQLAKLLAEGWDEGTKRIVELSDELRALIPTPMGPRRRLRWQDQGDEVCMHRVYSGQLDRAWRSAPRQRAHAPRVISIDADVGHNANVDAQDLFWAGAAAVALTDALEDAGYRVELFSTSATLGERQDSGGTAVLSRMVAKRASERLSPGLAAALVSLPATFRWYHLQSWLKSPTFIGWGHGTSLAIKEALDAAVEEGILEGSEVVIRESLSRESAIRECKAAIERITQEQDAGEGSMA